MFRLLLLAGLAAVVRNGHTAPPVRVTIDCGSHQKEYGRASYRSRAGGSQFDVDSFCGLIHSAIPQAIKGGRFVLREPPAPDLAGHGDTLAPLSAPPPEGFIPKFSLPKLRVPKLRVPEMNVPRLSARDDIPLFAPKLGPKSVLPTLRSSTEEESSAERMERFKKGVQKMLHVVSVLGQIDRYLSDRTRILVDKLARTFAD